jgi:hypothetical protein
MASIELMKALVGDRAALAGEVLGDLGPCAPRFARITNECSEWEKATSKWASARAAILGCMGLHRMRAQPYAGLNRSR